jgi:cytoskeletal protein CcmA (bactofilin family)
VGIWKRSRGRQSPLPPALPAEIHAAEQGPEFLAPGGALRTALGPDDSITGKLCFSAPTRIDGTLRGEVRSTDLIVVGETAVVDGPIRATSLVVLGRVHGDVLGAERVEVGPRGVLQGAIETQDLVVREGGRLEGHCRVAPLARATVHALRPRGEDVAQQRDALPGAR